MVLIKILMDIENPLLFGEPKSTYLFEFYHLANRERRSQSGENVCNSGNGWDFGKKKGGKSLPFLSSQGNLKTNFPDRIGRCISYK